jgi:seryl-tRNA synthetase
VSSFFGLLSYVLLVGTISLGIEEFLRKRDEEFKDKRRMKVVFAVLIIMGGLNLVSFYHDNNEKEQKEKTAEKENSDLQRKVESATQAQNTAIRAQKDNTAQFLTKVGELSDKVNELQHQVTTAELQKKLASVQAELLNTQKAMAPGPKATLAFSFVPFENPPAPRDMVPRTDVELPVNGDGSVHVEFSIVNVTNVNALSASITLVICDQCTVDNDHRA